MAKTIEIKVHPVESSNIAGIGYHEGSATLAVNFRNGNLYHFLDVKKEDYEDFKGAESVGRHFQTSIRGKFKTVNMGSTKKEK